MNDILKGTKVVLSNEKGFKNYMNNYSMFTTKQSFKFPDINDYPLFKVNSSFLLPIKKVKNTNNEDKFYKKRLKLKKKITLSKEFFLNIKYLFFINFYCCFICNYNSFFFLGFDTVLAFFFPFFIKSILIIIIY